MCIFRRNTYFPKKLFPERYHADIFQQCVSKATHWSKTHSSKSFLENIS